MYVDALAEFGVGGSHPGGLLLTKKLLDNEEIQSSSSILDIGCGTGLSAYYLYEKYQCDVKACDIHPMMIEKANQRFKLANYPIEVVYGDAEALDFPDCSFDYLLSESVTAFTDSRYSLKEYWRVLKPQGRLIAVEMVHDESLPKPDQEKIKAFYRFQSFLTIDQWKQKLFENNFSSIIIEPYLPKEVQEDIINDISPSASIHPKLHDTVLEHGDIVQTYREKMFPVVITATK
ncbi:class I SAM-dependent methyltransferase [Halalkalibacter urbisdiaboli]|uniref:class I SAM-dependent methyltransferase n=1 Tax=Halalkalibacter urbisdiaboli TaxID=1960589 RepID=UPI000B43672A|nr:class I SAM-dependent methyltransferase [Halalkalibacter urbisdiaboli]